MDPLTTSLDNRNRLREHYVHFTYYIDEKSYPDEKRAESTCIYVRVYIESLTIQCVITMTDDFHSIRNVRLYKFSADYVFAKLFLDYFVNYKRISLTQIQNGCYYIYTLHMMHRKDII